MPKKKPKRRKSSDLRSDILAAAQQVFTERGYAAASTREIAERANAAEPLIFRHFEKKAKLFAAAVFDPIERTLDEHLGELRKLYNTPRSPIEGMRSYVEVILGTIRRNKRLFIAYLNAITFHAEDFTQSEGGHAPPSFQARLVYLERTSSEIDGKSTLVILDRHFETRLILLFLCSVGLFDDLFFDALEQDDERVIRSVVKLLTMGVGVGHVEAATLKDAYGGSEATKQQDLEVPALKEENQKLRAMLTDAMLELYSLRNDNRRVAAGGTVVENRDPIENYSQFMRATVKTLFEAVSVADGEAVRPLLADDAIMELPFAIPPFPSAKSGGDAIASGMKGGSRLFTSFRLTPQTFYPSPETNSIVVEVQSEGQLTKGGTYSNQYVFIFKFANGKIILWREYFNPLRLPDLS
jgi:AcrR family transcriptional regulator/ketosteroid isomerase-like protein